MKPGDHPDFYRLAPPPGASRESTIRLDKEGRFWHDGERVEHQAMEQALRSWVASHPDDGRPILTNGYDWCYFQVDDAPLFVSALHVSGDAATLVLFDGTEEALDPAVLSLGVDGVVYARVRGGKLEARFSRHAQTQLEPLLVNAEPPTLALGGREVVLPARTASGSGERTTHRPTG
ncbi:hypothetical protein [Chondromyces apiculatus]|uniref:DUF1285 domain-containing protein n=1 Tax=Chondromyces apiculatus DSM 436 TaxID=1192034 RepID=A0A017T5T5_9BACT|nr:hypothetical protein [Chondromyces apiculatus]EYF04618.1 Hypothetical protein CAP_4294 [Chondromyces apiculatus DSM 436]